MSWQSHGPGPPRSGHRWQDRQRSSGDSWIDMQPLDPKVPVFTGEGGHQEFRQWQKFAQAFALSLKDEDKPSAGNRLLLNLRGEAAHLAEQFEPHDLANDDDCF